MRNKKQQLSLLCVFFFFILLVSALIYQKQGKSQEYISDTAFKLNTIVTINIYDSTDTTLLKETLALCDKYEKLFSRTMESSELYQLNHGTLPKKQDAFIISDETSELLSKALEYSRLSDGGFDLTIEPISSIWDFTSEEKKVPTDSEITNILPLVNYKNLILDGNLVQFKQKGMGIDLGAIAKGYIADRMKDFLISKGIKSATINLGGNVLCIGNKPDGTPFNVGIQKPFANRNETISTINISDKSVVSSGIYERFFEKNNKFYHHILNPKTGYPYDNSLVSVTIISDKSVDGDGLSTTCFALGLEKGMKLINSLPDTEALFITDDYKLHYSNNFPHKNK